jgi:hypothetical protein
MPGQREARQRLAGLFLGDVKPSTPGTGNSIHRAGASPPTVTSALASCISAPAVGSRPANTLATAAMMYREMDMSFWLEQAEAETRELT